MTREDQDHLRILSILYYVVGGLSALGGCGILFYFMFIGTIFTTAANQPGMRGGPPPAIGGIFVGVGFVAMLFTWALAACIYLTGRFLAERRNYIFCLVIAALICMQMPLGTVLGVFTIIVLVRPSVKAGFQGQPSSEARLVEQERFGDVPPPPPGPSEDQGHYR